MRQMRNVRTGKVAVYDADLIESGRWEEVRPEPRKESALTRPTLTLAHTKAEGRLEISKQEVPHEHVSASP